MAITLFRNEHYFLSSMYPLSRGVITKDGVEVSCVEIGYQADKFKGSRTRDRILESKNGFVSKRLANTLLKNGEAVERQGWEQDKISVMRWYVWQKFGRNPDVADMLVATDEEILVEGNTRDDDFWGAVPDNGGVLQGRNQLGLLLMDARSLLTQNIDLVEAANEPAVIKVEEPKAWVVA